MTTTLRRDGFEERLLPMLRQAAMETVVDLEGPGTRGRTRGPLRRVRFVLLAAAVAALGLVAGSATGGRETVIVDGLRALREPRVVEQELRAAGINAKIVEVPLATGPPRGMLHGRWWWIALDRPYDLTVGEFDRLYFQVGSGNAGTDIEGLDPDGGYPRFLELPKMEGRIMLFVGREVSAGEFAAFPRWDHGNELSPVGAFYCLGLDPNDPRDLGAALEARGYRIEWIMEMPSNRERDGGGMTSPPADAVATWAWLSGPDTVRVHLAPAGHWAERYQASEGTYPKGVAPPWEPPCD